jgi:hypothetical protein
MAKKTTSLFMQFGNICTFFPLPHFRNIQKLGSNGLLKGWVPNLSKHGECHLHTSGRDDAL